MGRPLSNKKKIKPIRKRKLKDVDLLAILQKEFPNNSYVHKVSKTFISRRLYKKVIYRHIFEYKEDGNIVENKLRSAGECFVYKYGKFIFKFENDEIQNTDKIDEILGKELKQQFAKVDTGNKEYIIAGKIGSLAIELISRVLRQNLFSKLGVVKVLVSEFNEKEKNVRIIFCDEKILKSLRDDWKNLEIVRKYIKQIEDNEK